MAIIYEHPLKDHIRVFLRIEKLFSDLDKLMRFDADPGFILTQISAVIRCLERPDLKSKLTNVLHHQRLHLQTFTDNPSIEQSKLQATLYKIDQKLALLKSHAGLSCLMPSSHPLLNKCKSELVSHGAVALAADPILSAWANMPVADAKYLLNSWRLDLEELHSIINLVLSLIRQGRSFHSIACNSHFYSHIFDGDLSMIRLKLPANVAPEFSAGGRRFTIRFQSINFLSDRLETIEQEVAEFDMALCI